MNKLKKTFGVYLETPSGKELDFTTQAFSQKEIRQMVKKEFPKHNLVEIVGVK